MQCTLCNEGFERAEIDLGEVIKVEGEFWHSACYDEYYEEVLETV